MRLFEKPFFDLLNALNCVVRQEAESNIAFAIIILIGKPCYLPFFERSALYGETNAA